MHMGSKVPGGELLLEFLDGLETVDTLKQIPHGAVRDRIEHRGRKGPPEVGTESVEGG
jgi:hypothetical protein